MKFSFHLALLPLFVLFVQVSASLKRTSRQGNLTDTKQQRSFVFPVETGDTASPVIPSERSAFTVPKGKTRHVDDTEVSPSVTTSISEPIIEDINPVITPKSSLYFDPPVDLQVDDLAPDEDRDNIDNSPFTLLIRDLVDQLLKK